MKFKFKVSDFINFLHRFKMSLADILHVRHVKVIYTELELNHFLLAPLLTHTGHWGWGVIIYPVNFAKFNFQNCPPTILLHSRL